MGQAWARNIAATDGVELAGWADVSREQLDRACAALGQNPEVDTDYPALLDRVRPDFVVDITPPEIHRDVVVHALRAGYPVIGEKPMAHSMEAAREMVAASRESGKLYMVSQSRRYIERQDAYRALLQQVGPLGTLNVDFYIGAHFGGFRDEMPSPLVLDMAIHTFDQARYLTGADPVEVYCLEFNPSWSWYKGDASATAIFTMSDGCVYTYRGSWCSEGLNTSWEGEWRGIGAKGTALWDGGSKMLAEKVEGGEGFIHAGVALDAPAPQAAYKGGIEGSLAEFLDALESGVRPNGECSDNIKSLAMVFGAILSSKERRPVRISADELSVL